MPWFHKRPTPSLPPCVTSYIDAPYQMFVFSGFRFCRWRSWSMWTWTFAVSSQDELLTKYSGFSGSSSMSRILPGPTRFYRLEINIMLYVAVSCKLNNTQVCNEHLFRQVSTRTGRYQLPIFRCTNVHPRRYARPYFRRAIYWCHEIHYLDKLAHVQVVINCRYSIAQMCTREDMLAHILGAPFIDDVMRYNTLVTINYTHNEL